MDNNEPNPLSALWKAKGLSLRDYQIEGISAMRSWHRNGHGGINGDEMGLGKTCQAIVMMLRLSQEGKGPFLVIAPLSVCKHWEEEVKRFACGTLEPINYIGYKADRQEIIKNIQSLKKTHIFITAHHLFRIEHKFIKQLQTTAQLSFDVIVVDEAQAIKNSQCMLINCLRPYKGTAWFLLMTGTPIQNNLCELYSLLTLVDHNRFIDKVESEEAFNKKYSDIKNIKELKKILRTYMIRRTKNVVCKDIPDCQQVVLYHDITEMQKKLYLDIISKNYLTFTNAEKKYNMISLLNVLMQLRKCVSHPYLFKGIEPEPYVEGEHLIEASGKLQVLDCVLRYLKSRKHRCLIFSQFVMVLDIIQDFLSLRGWKYERIDGSIRAEERFASITRFQASKSISINTRLSENDPWCFLLTTKAGGIGLNLTNSDTVIFLDGDWNPQNDLQALARCHRIGQDKPVRVIRLVGRYTIEQHMQGRARDKLRFTEKVMGNNEAKLTGVDIARLVKTNLGQLTEKTYEKFKLSDKELEKIIGRTDENGRWMNVSKENGPKNDRKKELITNMFLDADEIDKVDTCSNDYTVFEGVCYRVSFKDEMEFEKLRLENDFKNIKRKRRAIVKDINGGSDSYKHAKLMSLDGEQEDKKAEKEVPSRSGKLLVRKLKAQQKKEQKWRANGYISRNLQLPIESENSDYPLRDIEEEVTLRYVYGDVTRGNMRKNDSALHLILHCVDNSGSFGFGGIFSALRAKDPTIAECYETMYKMGDIALGDAHLLTDLQDLREVLSSSSSSVKNDAVVLFVAQNHKNRDEIRPEVLEQCFSRIGDFAQKNNAIVHMARIGYGTSLSWYTVERLIKKHFSYRGVMTYIYYFTHKQRQVVEEPDRSDDETGDGDAAGLINVSM